MGAVEVGMWLRVEVSGDGSSGRRINFERMCGGGSGVRGWEHTTYHAGEASASADR